MEKILSKGVGASPGRASGAIAFSAVEAERRGKGGEAIVFLCDEAGAEDRGGIEAAVAVVSVRGGLTGDAAIMARALGKPCVIGVTGVRVLYNEKKAIFRVESEEIAVDELTRITVDGRTGQLTFA